MSFRNIKTLMYQLGLAGSPAAKRIPRNRNVWGTETEELENRALLSAANCDLSEPPVANQVARIARRTPVQFPAVSGNWNVQAGGEFFNGTGTAVISQDGRKVTAIISIDGFGEFETKGTFKRRTPSSLTFKTPRLDIPDVPIDLRLKVTINFPPSELEPTTFTGTIRAPFVGTVGTLDGMKTQPT